jgi:hypothetical protein
VDYAADDANIDTALGDHNLRSTRSVIGNEPTSPIVRVQLVMTADRLA